jgi:hypothetical protein
MLIGKANNYIQYCRNSNLRSSVLEADAMTTVPRHQDLLNLVFEWHEFSPIACTTTTMLILPQPTTLLCRQFWMLLRWPLLRHAKYVTVTPNNCDANKWPHAMHQCMGPICWYKLIEVILSRMVIYIYIYNFGMSNTFHWSKCCACATGTTL